MKSRQDFELGCFHSLEAGTPALCRNSVNKKISLFNLGPRGEDLASIHSLEYFRMIFIIVCNVKNMQKIGIKIFVKGCRKKIFENVSSPA